MEEEISEKRGSVYNFACTECRKAHKACSKTRPCVRCVSLGIEHRCRSIARKKRRRSIHTARRTRSNKPKKTSRRSRSKSINILRTDPIASSIPVRNRGMSLQTPPTNFYLINSFNNSPQSSTSPSPPYTPPTPPQPLRVDRRNEGNMRVRSRSMFVNSKNFYPNNIPTHQVRGQGLMKKRSSSMFNISRSGRVPDNSNHFFHPMNPLGGSGELRVRNRSNSGGMPPTIFRTGFHQPSPPQPRVPHPPQNRMQMNQNQSGQDQSGQGKILPSFGQLMASINSSNNVGNNQFMNQQQNYPNFNYNNNFNSNQQQQNIGNPQNMYPQNPQMNRIPAPRIPAPQMPPPQNQMPNMNQNQNVFRPTFGNFGNDRNNQNSNF